jgi:hypothetical protein
MFKTLIRTLDPNRKQIRRRHPRPQRQASLARAALSASILVTILAASAAAQVATPLKAKGIKGEFVTAYQPCETPSMTAESPLAYPACPLVRNDPICGFGPTGKGKYALKVSGSDLKISASLSGLEGCGPSLILVADLRITLTDCTGPDCTIVPLEDFPLGPCTVSDGKCKIATTFEDFLLVEDIFSDGETYNIEFGEVCFEAGGFKPFCGGIVIGVAQPGLTTSTTTTSTSSTTSTTLVAPCTPVGGSCWTLGQPGDGCDAACFQIGMSYDPATETYAGSGGTNANCTAVLVDLLGSPFAIANDTTCAAAVGCQRDLFFPGLFRCTSPPTNGGASAPGIRRACACQ